MLYDRRGFHRVAIAMLLSMSPFSRAYSVGDADAFLSSSGDDDLDRALNAEFENVIHFFGIHPGLRYNHQDNAYYTNDTVVEGTRGTLVLGLPFVRKLMTEDGEVAVAAICAHSCAHAYQFDHDLWNKLASTLHRELHADFHAGYYIGKRPERERDMPRWRPGIFWPLSERITKIVVADRVSTVSTSTAW
jgi:hypothetical protein